MTEAAADPKPSDGIPAATVVLGRDAPTGLEVLMLRRTSKAAFAPDAWVFPGGRVDPADTYPDGTDPDGTDPDGTGQPDALDSLASARRAAVRETQEEAGIVIAGPAMHPIARWSPNADVPRRFLTWMFFAPAPQPVEVEVDGGEIVDHRWIRPADAIRAHAAGELLLLPPTWVTLNFLALQRDCVTAIEQIKLRPVDHFHSRITDDGHLVLWEGDAGYDTGDPLLPGGRHRLVMNPGAWRYERTAGEQMTTG
jgi:8-oxo-dGTP pyrophosphatase MutT (NUDIX family)